MSTYFAAPREKRYHKYKKVLYLEPPINGSKTIRNRITTIIPPPEPAPYQSYQSHESYQSYSPPPPPMMPEHRPTPPPPMVVNPLPPPPPPAPYIPEREPELDTEIEVIAVDVEPDESVKSGRSSKSSSKSSSRSSRSSRSSHRHHREQREVYIERERMVPVRVPVPYHVHHVEIEQPQQDSFRYIEAPRRYEPPQRRSLDQEIVIEDHRHRKYIRDG